MLYRHLPRRHVWTTDHDPYWRNVFGLSLFVPALILTGACLACSEPTAIETVPVPPSGVDATYVSQPSGVDEGEQNVESAIAWQKMWRPEACGVCHEVQFQQWRMSTHARGRSDPLYQAFETWVFNDLGTAQVSACRTCHDPLSLSNDADAAAVAARETFGIDCSVCHNAVLTTDTAGAKVVVARDFVVRTARDANQPNDAHPIQYSLLNDSTQLGSVRLCATCHKSMYSTTVAGTYSEWRSSIYGRPGPDEKSCNRCHIPLMAMSPSHSVEMGGQIHNHEMRAGSGYNVLAEDAMLQRRTLQRVLNKVVGAQICVSSDDEQHTIRIILENSGVGHDLPAVAHGLRRLWAEVIVYDLADNVLFSSGVVDDNTPLSAFDDSTIWRFDTQMQDADGKAEMRFWRVEQTNRRALRAPTARVSDPEYKDIHRTRRYRYAGTPPAYVSLRVKYRPIAFDVVDRLVADGLLDPLYRASLPTFDLGFARLDWAAEDRTACVPSDHVEPFQ